jgi:hypothetical protein
MKQRTLGGVLAAVASDWAEWLVFWVSAQLHCGSVACANWVELRRSRRRALARRQAANAAE